MKIKHSAVAVIMNGTLSSVFFVTIAATPDFFFNEKLSKAFGGIVLIFFPVSIVLLALRYLIVLDSPLSIVFPLLLSSLSYQTI